MPSSAVTIALLRASAPAEKSVVARLAIDALTGELVFTRYNVPPQAILTVRQLKLPVRAGDLTRVPTPDLLRRFGSTAAAALNKLAEHAARPAFDIVTDNFDAILFSDDAELLACLARDAAGNCLHRWWWRLILGKRYPEWAQAFVMRHQAIPGALRLLSKWGLETFTLNAIALHFGTAEPHRGSPFAHRAQVARTSQPGLADSQLATKAMALEKMGGVRGMQVAACVPPTDLSCSPTTMEFRGASCRFVAITPSFGRGSSQEAASDSEHECLSANRSPRVALGSTATELQRRRKYSTCSALREFSLIITSTDMHSVGEPSGTERLESTPRSPLPQHRPGAAGLALEPPPSELPGSLTDSSSPGLVAQLIERVRVGPARTPLSRVPNCHSQVESRGTSLAEASLLNGPEPHLQSVTSAPSYSLEQPTPVYSNFAGAFFLVNVLLAQGLYPDFTRPRDKGFAVPLWQLLALVSLRLAGWRLRGDPLWLLLLQLEPANATDDCRDLDAFWVPPTPMRPPRGADILSRWLNGFVRWLRPNLSESLGWSLREVGLRLLSARARIWATASEISVIYSLQDHPVEVRLAGLDRDPGYLPSVGRKLRFFFE